MIQIVLTKFYVNIRLLLRFLVGGMLVLALVNHSHFSRIPQAEAQAVNQEKNYTTPTAGTSFQVPSNVTSITVKAWGGAGGSGGSSGGASSGIGGGGGYITGVITTIPGETLTIAVGGGGAKGIHTSGDQASDGGGSGGYSGVFRGSDPLIIAGGGGGGGGTADSSAEHGGAGGAGGGTSGVAGSDGANSESLEGHGGGGGTSSAGGAGGSGGAVRNGEAGAFLQAGRGAGYSALGNGPAGGTNGAAGGLRVLSGNYAGGGGGGGGYYGGGGGEAGDNEGGGGGGGGSSWASTTVVSSVTNTAGSGVTPGNSGDSDRVGNVGEGGASVTNADGYDGNDGQVYLTYSCSGSCGASGSTRFTTPVYITASTSVLGTLAKGSGSFVIDHPLDPENKLLYHSFVESPDVKNIYDGIVTLNEAGEAVVALPDYYEALNGTVSARFLLTPLGVPAPDLYVTEAGIKNNTFTIAGGPPHARVSWQVTGIRQDPYILANPIINEVAKGPEALVDVGEYVFEGYEE